MRFEHLIDHSEGWTGDESYSSTFKEFTSHITEMDSVPVSWQDKLFVSYRPIPQHLVKLRVLTPFGTDHTALLRFSCYQPKDPFIVARDGYFMRFNLKHNRYLAPGHAPIDAAFSMHGAISAVEMGSLFYDNLIEQWLNRVYLQVIEQV